MICLHFFYCNTVLSFLANRCCCVHAGSWSPRYNTQNEWIQIDFESQHRVEKVSTRGRPDTGRAQWVTSYNLARSLDGTNFEPASGPHNVNVNTPNTRTTIVLTEPLVGRSFRLLPISWNNHISMRLEFEGCKSKLL